MRFLTLSLESVEARVRERLTEIKRIKIAIDDTEKSLASAKREHSEVIEGWQAELGLGKTAKEPKELSRLASAITEFSARQRGLRKRLAAAWEVVAELAGPFGEAMKQEDSHLVSQHSREIAQAREAFHATIRRAIGVEQVLGATIVEPADRGKRVTLPDGRNVYESLPPIEPDPELKSRRRMLSQVEAAADLARRIRRQLAEEANPPKQPTPPGLLALSMGIIGGRTRTSQEAKR